MVSATVAIQPGLSEARVPYAGVATRAVALAADLVLAHVGRPDDSSLDTPRDDDQQGVFGDLGRFLLLLSSERDRCDEGGEGESCEHGIVLRAQAIQR